MWFDAHAKLAEIAGAPPATSATSATRTPMRRAVSQLSQLSQAPTAENPAPRVAIVAIVATPPKPKSEPAPVRADGLEADAGAFLDFLRLHGPQSYGAVARALGWGATRAWRAEAELRAAGRILYRCDGKSEMKSPHRCD